MENSGPGSTSGSTSVRRLNSPVLAWSFRQNDPERPESFSSWPEVALGFSPWNPKRDQKLLQIRKIFSFFVFVFEIEIIIIFFLNWLDLGLAPIEEEEKLEEDERTTNRQ